MWLGFYLEAMHKSFAEHFLLNPFKEVQMSEQWGKQGYLTNIVYVCMCMCLCLADVNLSTLSLTWLPSSHVAFELTQTPTYTFPEIHTHTRPGQARPHCLLLRVSWLGDPTETDRTKISLQGSRVNTSRCNINSISHGKSLSGMAARRSQWRSVWEAWGTAEFCLVFFSKYWVHLMIVVFRKSISNIIFKWL